MIIEEIYPRHGCGLQIVSDNGTENVNKTVKETLPKLKIDHVLTSVYHPQSNAKVGRFHRTLHDILAKKISDNQQTWDLFLNQALAAIRFNVSESSKFSPFFLLYNRDVVLPVDNILKPRRKYVGEEMHPIALQEQHKSFVAVRNHLRKAKKRQAKYADRGTKTVECKVGDPVYYNNNQREDKLDLKWQPYYRILEKRGPVTYVIKNQLNGSTCKVHAEILRLANIEDWQISKDETDKRLRDAAYVIPPEPSDSDSDSDPEMTLPLAKLAKRYRHERDPSEDEEDNPLLELRNMLRHRDRNQGQDMVTRDEHMESQDEGLSGPNDSDNAMDVNEIQVLYRRPKIKPVKTVKRNQNLTIRDTVYFSC